MSEYLLQGSRCLLILYSRIKKAYRKKALELHPDRNYGDVENATTKFAEVQSAYEVLSDDQERAWYDSHRDSILRGDSSGASDGDHYEHNVRVTSAIDIVRLISRFHSRIPFTDDSTGFYGVLRDTFAKLAEEEYSACDWEGLEIVQYPDFGSSIDDYEDVVKPFYRVWMNFSTKKTFSWRDAYRASDAPDRATRRLVEKENKRLRDEGIREFNDAVRALVAFVRKRDPRFVPNSQTEADRQKILRDAAAAQAARSRAANRSKFNQHIVPDWAQTSPATEEADSTESEDLEEVEHIECIVCGKTFKSEKQYETHEKSKKHIKAVQQLQREMRKENKYLNLNDISHSGSGVPNEEFERLSVVENWDGPSIGEQSAPKDLVNDLDKEDRQKYSHTDPETTESPTDGHNGVEEDFLRSSESDDEYAPREDVENRLTSTPVGSRNITHIRGENLAPETAAAFIASDNDNASNKPPKLGKAKAKRAKKAARQEVDSEGQVQVI